MQALRQDMARAKNPTKQGKRRSAKHTTWLRTPDQVRLTRVDNSVTLVKRRQPTFDRGKGSPGVCSEGMNDHD
eukprot:10442-Eustigmatos_ZCMA.PRE.1